jgi:hypothetical protein
MMTSHTNIEPFTIAIPEADLEGLPERLRLPQAARQELARAVRPARTSGS